MAHALHPSAEAMLSSSVWLGRVILCAPIRRVEDADDPAE